MLYDSVFLLGIKLSNSVFISIVLVIGYLFLHRDNFALLIILCLYSVTANSYLKEIWQIQLNHEVFKDTAGWAFPSGHTQSIFLMWSYICWQYPKPWLWLRAIACFLFTECSIIYFQYHNFIEIIGGVLVAASLVLILQTIRLLTPMRPPLIAAMILVLHAVTTLKIDTLSTWLWLSLARNISFYLGWIMLERHLYQFLGWQRVALLGVFISVPMAYLVNDYMHCSVPTCLLQGVFDGIWISYIAPSVFTMAHLYFSKFKYKFVISSGVWASSSNSSLVSGCKKDNL
jgi:hypothetical protein